MFLDQYGEAVEFDLARYAHMDILDLGGPGLSFRRLRSFLGFLPRDSATAKAVHGEDVQWGLQEQLLAAGVDALHAANWQRGRGKGRRPRPIPRPGVQGHTVERVGKATRPLHEMKAKQRAWAAGKSGKVDRPSLARQIRGEEPG